MPQLHRKSLLSIFALTALSLLCQYAHADEKSAAVEGTVTYNGKPIEGKIVFHFDAGQFAGSKIKNGKYVVDRVPAGTCKVSVEGKNIPLKYAEEETSGLTVEVQPGKFNFDVVLSD